MTTSAKPLDVEGISGPSTAYPAAVIHGDLLFVSGQVSFTDTGAVAHDGDVRGQVRQTFRRLDRVLGAAGAGRGDVISSVVYLTDASAAPALNEEWRSFFGDHRPARATVIAGLLDPRLLVEISVIAATPPQD